MIKIEQRIQEAIQKNTPFIIAIDGNAGSGKTTLVKSLVEKYPIDVISMDDFFLPFELKNHERLSQPGNNFHYERFLQEIVPNIYNDNPWTYEAYNCQTKTFSPKKLEGKRIKIVEGVYSCHPLFQNIYDFKVGIRITESLQQQRILKRNGQEMWAKFQSLWIPQENNYFDHFQIFTACEYIIEADQVCDLTR